MDTKAESREFLTSRRAKITPEKAGLTAYGPRRVAGLRREEVAVLAGVSVPYYTRLERGDLSGVSEGVLEALARAAARRRRTRAPVRSRPRGRADDQTAPPLSAEADPARRAAPARCDHRRAR